MYTSSITQTPLTRQQYRAYRTFSAGLAGAVVLVMFASGRTKEAYVLGAASALVVAIVEAAELLSER